MAELTVESTYGRALFEAARDENKVEIILDEVKQIRDLFIAEPDFYEFINTPVLSGAEKKHAVEQIFQGKISPEVLNFLFILIDKRRTRAFSGIVNQYQSILDEIAGISKGVIYSVEPLTGEQLEQFEQKTGKLLKKNVKLENKIDTTILGGVKVFIEGKVLDATIRKRLDDLKGNLKSGTL
ncbi:F0F1 ATP synthase subunit delta [Clostridium aminobutyricum]|uniref:ATP synthase subunit delta n=1 Tax=Clostridium aminobutyricum TaxID=33953 RepID=A0A939D8I0_CLOAM|nr:F0F1 ATP synthase subunit delta [Clostridium aminobutyricum]MBN7773070.1 F0F1 ATP synthase subunit delta [Clostridium aminobutyricum]